MLEERLQNKALTPLSGLIETREAVRQYLAYCRIFSFFVGLTANIHTFPPAAYSARTPATGTQQASELKRFSTDSASSASPDNVVFPSNYLTMTAFLHTDPVALSTESVIDLQTRAVELAGYLSSLEKFLQGAQHLLTCSRLSFFDLRRQSKKVGNYHLFKAVQINHIFSCNKYHSQIIRLTEVSMRQDLTLKSYVVTSTDYLFLQDGSDHSYQCGGGIAYIHVMLRFSRKLQVSLFWNSFCPTTTQE